MVDHHVSCGNGGWQLEIVAAVAVCDYDHASQELEIQLVNLLAAMLHLYHSFLCSQIKTSR